MEENTEFLDDVRKAVGGKGAIFACEAGGSLRATPNFPYGKASRSLKVSTCLRLCCKQQPR